MFPNGTNTYIGIITSVLPFILSFFHLAPTPAFNSQFPDIAMAVVSLLGAGYAIYGRARASVPGWFAKTTN